MLTLKVLLKDAQKWKSYLSNNSLFDKAFVPKKDKEFIYYPVKRRFDVYRGNVEFIDTKLEPSSMHGSFKQQLKQKLTEEEQSLLRAAYDTIGDIAILEIPDRLKKREKLIAKALIDTNHNIKTVLKKAASHEGTFRTQKMKHLAGKKNTETIYKENGVIMKLDVEKVYFSIRLSNERKRIAELVKPGEEILVMFSGCAPYPLVIAKNSRAKNITAIEINPWGHKYALENLTLNRLNNIVLVNADVKKAIPNIFEYIIGMKCSLKPHELTKPMKALAHKARIFEIHLYDNDLFEHRQRIEDNIKKFQKQGFRVYMHMPFRFYEKQKENGITHYNLSREEIGKEIVMFDILGELSRKYDVKAIIHINFQDYWNSENAIAHLKLFEKYFDYFYFETGTTGFSNIESVLEVGKRAGIKNIAIDISHLFIIYKDTDKMVSVIKKIKENFNTYFHIADNNKITHTCEIGKGFIDFNKIAPLINTGIIEVEEHSYIVEKEMLSSFKTLNRYSHLRKFDRIIMPLPRTADEFLDEALMASKKGTIIHFYDFQKEHEFKKAIDKIDKACKKHKIKYKILETIKCGQHAPYVFRICVDFEIIYFLR